MFLIVPISRMDAGYVVNPTKDMVPICPNCRAILHRRSPPYRVQEVRHWVVE